MNKHEEHEGRELVREHAENPEQFERIEALGNRPSNTYFGPPITLDPMLERALNAERQLSEARDGWREEIAKAQADMRRAEAEINRLRERLAEASDQRDTLAEALEKIERRSVIAGSTGDYRQGQLDALNACASVARVALAAAKGGAHE